MDSHRWVVKCTKNRFLLSKREKYYPFRPHGEKEISTLALWEFLWDNLTRQCYKEHSCYSCCAKPQKTGVVTQYLCYCLISPSLVFRLSLSVNTRPRPSVSLSLLLSISLYSSFSVDPSQFRSDVIRTTELMGKLFFFFSLPFSKSEKYKNNSVCLDKHSMCDDVMTPAKVKVQNSRDFFKKASHVGLHAVTSQRYMDCGCTQRYGLALQWLLTTLDHIMCMRVG